MGDQPIQIIWWYGKPFNLRGYPTIWAMCQANPDQMVVWTRTWYQKRWFQQKQVTCGECFQAQGMYSSKQNIAGSEVSHSAQQARLFLLNMGNWSTISRVDSNRAAWFRSPAVVMGIVICLDQEPSEKHSFQGNSPRPYTISAVAFGTGQSVGKVHESMLSRTTCICIYIYVCILYTSNKDKDKDKCVVVVIGFFNVLYPRINNHPTIRFCSEKILPRHVQDAVEAVELMLDEEDRWV